MAETSKTPSSPKKEQNPSKPLPNFLYKLIFVSVLIALLPIFPSSQSPELSNKSILTQTWELLHLLLVGIAISYGLFSRRNSDHDIEKETQLKPDTTPESYVSQILQVPSVFDEEEIQSPKGLDLADEGKNQTWNYNQYYREEPVVMVAKERGVEE
ncbi:uncharacterized protein A4U43_C10F7580 [Asparagus officinalis]|uniref:Uncharacterized protein n=1 Tax=Asparagus officinalis TaxID=4686 RepID=A0A5P1E5T2_ASPOF|nr:uncharacterized protein A4U43_C10F7580 [Asparagus officinalis]